MNRLSRDALLAIGLVVLLVAVSSAAAYWQARRDTAYPALANFSNQQDGARALRLWLDALEYTTTDTIPGFFAIPQDADMALILEPQLPGITEPEWESLDQWVEEGGVLLLIGEGFGMAFSLSHYDFDIQYLDAPLATADRPLPHFLSPPMDALANIRARAILQTERDDVVTLLTVDGDPVLVTWNQGEGQIILSSLTFPLTNEGLKESGNADLVLNLVSLAGPAGTIWFDEWHHGIRASTTVIAGPGQWLRETPAGRSLLYGALVVLVTLVIGGRRFGRPVPPAHSAARRSPREHIKAVANLNRRAGHRRAILARHRFELKRELGRRYRLPPSLPDEEYVARLAAYDPDLDANALQNLLIRMQQPSVSEGDLVALAQDADAWLKKDRQSHGYD